MLNEKRPSNYFWVLLQNDVDKNLPEIKIWSLFTTEDPVPYLQPNDPIKTFGLCLLDIAENEGELIDEYGQSVDLGLYNPNYMRIEQDFMAAFKEKRDKQPKFNIIDAIILDKISLSKASFALWEYKLINAFRYLRAQAKENIFHDMSFRLWDNYINKLMENITKPEINNKKKKEPIEDIPQPSPSLRLDRINVWREAGSWKYSDIVVLCKLGLPKELRPMIWSELLGLSGVHNPDFEANKAKNYEGYLEKARLKDCVIYRQIEQDVYEVTKLDSIPILRMNAIYKERSAILNIVKAYYAWSLEQNSKQPEESKHMTESIKNKYVYFKGILHLIQKVYQMFEEVEAFWCIIGFAKSMPYIFQSQDIMTGKLSQNQKLILLAISTILEIKYKDLYKSILRYGLPIEYYLSDHVFNMLSTIFPNETLMRFYDIIALEAASKMPIRAMWVIITGSIMLLTLNEVYIKAARSADEISLIIKNTGINKLNTQMLIENLYKQSSEIFVIDNPTWEKFMAVILNQVESAIGMEQTWTNKAFELELKYKEVRELNITTEELVNQIRELSSKKSIDDEHWMGDFVRRFCKYYKELNSKEQPTMLHIYLYKCHHLPSTVNNLTISINDYEDTVNIIEGKLINKAVEIELNPSYMNLKITVSGSEERSCEINLSDYETDMPITLDKVLNRIVPYEDSALPHERLKPQPFISFVFLIVSKEDEQADGNFKAMKKCLMHDSIFIKPNIKGPKNKQNFAAELKKNIQSQFGVVGLKSIYVPGMKAIAEEDKSSSEAEQQALIHLFSLVKNEDMSYYPQNMPNAEPEVENVASNVYNTFSKYYDGKLPLKRVIVSLIIASNLTVNTKLSYLYDLYTCFAVNSEAAQSESFLLDDIIELVKLLCELHLVYLPPESIPHLTEQIMTNGGINRITKCYLISFDAEVDDVLKMANLNGKSDRAKFIDVSSQVHDAFEDYWKIWGHKQVFASDPTSFCGVLSTILSGYKGRPSRGPYRLLICYKHKGESYFKELAYDQNERLTINREGFEDINRLLVENRYNLSFVGERIRMNKDEFVERIKRIPMLTELMRLNTSMKNNSLEKTPCEFNVTLEGNVEITFDVKEDYKPEDNDMPSSDFKYDDEIKLHRITIHNSCKEDLMMEIKDRIIKKIGKMLEYEIEHDIIREVPLGLTPENLNYSLQFHLNGTGLDDYGRFDSFVILKIILDFK